MLFKTFCDKNHQKEERVVWYSVIFKCCFVSIMSIKEPKILIIGAGASGIAAAVKLFEHGIRDITILEAENRLGGRICSVEFGGTTVDIGGQWVHGEYGNVVYEMVKDMDLLSPSKFSHIPGMSFFLLDGSIPEKSLSDKLFALAIAVKDDQECARKHGGNFADYFTSEYKSRVREEFSENTQALELAFLIEEWFKKFMVLLNPAEYWHQLSVTSHYVFRACEGDQMLGWRDKGYKTVLDVLTKKIPDPSKELPIKDKVILNKEVIRIDWSKDQVNIKCLDGSTFTADHVIVTVSVGVLKNSYKSLFAPALPEYKVNSIEGVPLGTVNKILLKFPRKWWPDNVKDISFLWSEEQKAELTREFPDGPVVNGRSWLENLFSFIAIDSHPNVLLGWINGPTATLVELLSDETIIKGCMFMLRKFAGKEFDIPNPDGMIRSRWGSNPHFRGSYAYVSAEMENRHASADDLAKPLTTNGRPLVLFAGEATHKYHFSTVNGAIETGHREADRIISLYDKKLLKVV